MRNKRRIALGSGGVFVIAMAWFFALQTGSVETVRRVKTLVRGDSMATVCQKLNLTHADLAAHQQVTASGWHTFVDSPPLLQVVGPGTEIQLGFDHSDHLESLALKYYRWTEDWYAHDVEWN